MSLFRDRVMGRRGGLIEDPVVASREGVPEVLRWEPADAAAWYAADFEESIFQDEAGTVVAGADDAVRRWATLAGDSSADGRRSGSSSLPRKATFNGRPAIRFERAWLDCQNLEVLRDLSQFTVCAVYAPVSAPQSSSGSLSTIWLASNGGSVGSYRAAIGFSNKDQRGSFGHRSDHDTYQYTVDGVPVLFGEAVAGIFEWDHANDTHSIYRNSDSPEVIKSPYQGEGSTSDTSSERVVIGGHINPRRPDAYIMEIVIFRRLMSAQEKLDFVNHCVSHWGVVPPS